MQFLSRLLRPLAGVFRRSPATEPEPEPGSTLELSRTDIEVLDVVWERF